MCPRWRFLTHVVEVALKRLALRLAKMCGKENSDSLTACVKYGRAAERGCSSAVCKCKRKEQIQGVLF